MANLEVLGITCNVMQTISFACETTKRCKAIYEGQNPESQLTEVAASLISASHEVQDTLKARNPSSQSERDLTDIADKCIVAARALEDEVKFLTGQAQKGNLASALRIATATNWRRRRLDHLDKSLREYQSTMQTHLLVRLCTRNDALELLQQQNFSKLDSNLQLFMKQYASGHTELSALVKSENSATRAYLMQKFSSNELSTQRLVDQRFGQIRDSINAHAERMSEETVEARQHEQLLRSLKFPSMNERHNDISAAHNDTFGWIFAYDEDLIRRNPMSLENTENPKERKVSIHDDLWDNFSDWLKSESSIYWINGKPGSGKSTLVKYLVSSPLTKVALDIQNPNTLILSHYFWKPGSKLQRTIKGLLCTMLHQILSQQPSIIDSVLRRDESLRMMDCDTDWSLEELMSLLRFVLTSNRPPLCIFIDGLDESTEEDTPSELIALINEMITSPRVKICVASRPEPTFQNHFARHQQLQLQQLTAEDMHTYASDKLEALLQNSQVSDRSRYDIMSKLVQKAEGVFLWLYLAIRSLITGLDHQNTGEELLERLEILPNQLSKLYFDMWSRLGDDMSFYRRKAAEYFNLVITASSMTDFVEKLHPQSCFYMMPLKRASVFQIMLATNSTVKSTLLQADERTDWAQLHKLCATACNDIRIRCAGLLELRPEGGIMYAWKSSDKTLKGYMNTSVGFLHRTAFDFFMETEEGAKIRQYDSSSQDERRIRLIEAYLANTRIATSPDDNFVSAPIFAIMEITTPSLWPSILDLLDVCYEWYIRGHLRYFYHKTPRPHFFSFLTFPCFKPLVLHAIAVHSDSKKLATAILRDLYYTELEIRDSWPKVVAKCYTKPLLQLGADPNAKGICNRVNGISRRSSKLSRFRGVDTAFCRLLKECLERNTCSYAESIDILLQIIPSILLTRPNFAERTALTISVGEGSFKTHDLDYADEWTPAQSTDDLGRTYLILEANLAFLHDALVSRMTCNPAHILDKLVTDPKILQSLSRDEAISPSMKLSYIIFRDGGRYSLLTQNAVEARVLDQIRNLLYGEIPILKSNLVSSIRNQVTPGNVEVEQVRVPIRALLAQTGCGYYDLNSLGSKKYR